MLYARKGNKQLEIVKKQQEEFLINGWTILEPKGGKSNALKIVATPKGNLEDENKKLKAELEDLKAKLSSK